MSPRPRALGQRARVVERGAHDTGHVVVPTRAAGEGAQVDQADFPSQFASEPSP
jgi:hypothetical protein